MTIAFFKSRALKRLFDADDTRGISGNLVQRVRNVLFALDQADRISATCYSLSIKPIE